MLDLLELQFGRYNGGQVAPIGSYLNPRTMAIFQQTADGKQYITTYRISRRTGQ